MGNWRDVVGFEGLYKVNRDGVIWSCYTKRVLKYSISKDGYKQWEAKDNDGAQSRCGGVYTKG